MMHNIKDLLTFAIPFRIDSEERFRNLCAVLKWLSPLGCKVFLLEADEEKKVQVDLLERKELIEYSFVKDTKMCFHRSCYINQLLRMANTKIVSVWDTDIIADYRNIREAVRLIVEKNVTLSYPYCGKFIMLTPECSVQFLKDADISKWDAKNLSPIFKRPFCGGAYFVDKNKYLQIGGENEKFTGWGPEDAERLRRTQITGCQVAWISEGNAYHLWHPRKGNSTFFDEDTCIAQRKELVKVCSMDKSELLEYIKTW